MPRVNDHLISRLDISHVRAHGVNDPTRVRADDVEVGGLTPSRLTLRDVDRDTPGGPDVVEVDPRSHGGDQDVVRPDLGDVDHLVPYGVAGVAEPVGTDEHPMHAGWNLAERGELTDVVDVLAHATNPSLTPRPWVAEP